MKNLLLFISIAYFISSCSKESISSIEQQEPDIQSFASMPGESGTEAKPFNKLFTRYGGGWTGGDAAYSIPLGGGKVLWLFGDSFLDTVYADRSRPASSLVRNTFVVQQGKSITTMYSGTPDAPDAFITTDDPDNEWYWPLDGTVQDGVLYVYMAYFIRTGDGAWDFQYQHTDLFQFSLPGFTEISRTTVWDVYPEIMFGATVMEDGEYLYIYSPETYTFTKYTHVARVPLNNLFATPEYYNGTDWVNTVPALTEGRLLKFGGSPVDVSAQYSVFFHEGKYRLVTQEGFLGPKIHSYESLSPTGPWKTKKLIYTTPENTGTIFTYNAFIHPEFSSTSGGLLMSYCLNTNNFWELFSNADSYRPKFVWIDF